MAPKYFIALSVLAAILGCSSAVPRPQHNTDGFTTQNDGITTQQILHSPIHGLPPLVTNFLSSGVPSGAQLINAQPRLPAIDARLPDNYTLIRPNVVDTFRCSGAEFPNGYRKYGYYADQDNACQIFHVCLPMQQLYPGNFTNPITYQFSFICPESTIFSQDVLVCDWANEAVPCEYAAQLYNVNDVFFTNKGLDGETYGNTYGNKVDLSLRTPRK